MKATIKNLWAPFRVMGDKAWPIVHYVRFTRKESKAAYLADYRPDFHKRALTGIKFCRVTITEQ